MTTEMVRQLTVNMPVELYNRLDATLKVLGETSIEDAINKLVLGGLIMIDHELDKRKLIQTPPALVGPDGQYIGRRTGG